jgi:hypothetical protein
MKLAHIALVTASISLCCVGVRAFQRVVDYGFGEDESPSNLKAEFYWSRLAYPVSAASLDGLGQFGGFGHHGYWGNPWSRDYPKADRQFLIAMRRLTRIDGRPTEQVVTLDSDDRCAPIRRNVYFLCRDN